MLLPLLRVYLNIVIPQVHVTYLEMLPLQSHSSVLKATRTILIKDAELRCDAVRTQDVTRMFAPFSHDQVALMSPKYYFKTVTASFPFEASLYKCYKCLHKCAGGHSNFTQCFVFSDTTAKPLFRFVCGRYSWSQNYFGLTYFCF